MSDYENQYEKTKRTIIVCVCVFLTACVVSCNAEGVVKKVLYADSLNRATAAGTDPMVVGCAWGFGQTGEAIVCSQAVANAKK